MKPSASSGGGSSSYGFEAFFAAIGGQESGGNYNAVNGRTGASGKYQIMPANVGPWSRQYLGYTISLSEFRRSPRLQEKLARAVLSDYYHRYGARGAAATWYSGRPGRANDYSSIGHGGEPSVGAYVDSVMGRMGKAGQPHNGAPYVMPEAEPERTRDPLNPVQVTRNETTPGAAIQDTRDQPMFAGLASETSPGLAAVETPGLASAPTPGGLATSTDSTGAVTPDATVKVPVPTASIDQQMSAGPKPGESASDFRDRIITSAMRYIGVPYVWGGTSPNGFDCSGIIQYVYGKLGFDLPRISADQARSGRRVGLNNLRVGDLVAWDNSGRNSGADHIAIYAGDGYIIEAPRRGVDVRRRKLGKSEDAWGVALDLPGD